MHHRAGGKGYDTNTGLNQESISTSDSSTNRSCDSKSSHGCKRISSGGSPLTSTQEENLLMGNNMQNNVSPASAGPSRPREALLPHNKFVLWFLKAIAGGLVLLFFVIPAFIKVYPAILLDVAFLNHFRWPPFLDLSKPEELGLNRTFNFRVETAPGISVGVWHTLPETLGNVNEGDVDHQTFIRSLQQGHPIVLYLHGNAGTRAAWHRVQLYKVLSKAGFQVVTFDYRGYGDSLGYPSEDGLVEDSIAVYRWVKDHSGNSPIYIWGHSLGSAVATKTSKRLNEAGEIFDGLILESPFNNFVEAASNHPLSLPFRVLPWFTWVFIEGIKMNDIRFASDENIAGVTVKTLVLHAVDDGVVPYELGRKLYDAAVRTKKGPVEFVTFDGIHGYGHKHIHKDPNLPEIIRKFTSRN